MFLKHGNDPSSALFFPISIKAVLSVILSKFLSKSYICQPCIVGFATKKQATNKPSKPKPPNNSIKTTTKVLLGNQSAIVFLS